MKEQRLAFEDVAGLTVAELLRRIEDGAEVGSIRIERGGRLVGALVAISGEHTHRYMSALRDRAVDIHCEREWRE